MTGILFFKFTSCEPLKIGLFQEIWGSPLQFQILNFLNYILLKYDKYCSAYFTCNLNSGTPLTAGVYIQLELLDHILMDLQVTIYPVTIQTGFELFKNFHQFAPNFTRLQKKKEKMQFYKHNWKEIDQLLLPYKFYGKDMFEIYFFIFGFLAVVTP